MESATSSDARSAGSVNSTRHPHHIHRTASRGAEEKHGQGDFMTDISQPPRSGELGSERPPRRPATIPRQRSESPRPAHVPTHTTTAGRARTTRSPSPPLARSAATARKSSVHSAPPFNESQGSSRKSKIGSPRGAAHDSSRTGMRGDGRAAKATAGLTSSAQEVSRQCPDAGILRLLEELKDHRQSSLAERKRFFMSQCVRWHPDKNRGNELQANGMFQLLQEKKPWFLALD